uniref:Receptor-binding cancer antigen expressed on SiSo cells n=1 Tax=Elaeophora elaphi TaxID=1147741 RepID=A0A0R3RYS2_9BILA
MSTIQALKKRALFIFRLIVAILSRLCCCVKRRKNIGELPFTVAHQNPQTYWKSVSNDEKWKGWSDTPFVTSVEEKIVEYRRKKAESEVVSEEKEMDFFNDMQPKVMQTRRAYIDNYQNTPIQNSNLFAVKTDEVPSSDLGELGNLEDMNLHDETEDWDNQIDIESVKNALLEQKAKERRERRLARQIEHAKRFERRKE